MKTSQEWYNEVKKSETKLIKWLKDQYHGEVTAAERIRSLILCYYPDDKSKEKFREAINTIAEQEEQHAVWVGELLLTRGVNPTKLVKSERYWNNTVKQIKDWNTGCAVAAHAEKMRLDRIEVIVNDKDTAEDIRKVFKKILVQERMHERVFREASTDEAMQKTLEGHLAGLNELGLKP